MRPFDKGLVYITELKPKKISGSNKIINNIKTRSEKSPWRRTELPL